jgi:hypothetical protein
MAVVGNDAVTNWLDSSLADYGLTIQAKQQVRRFHDSQLPSLMIAN